MHSAFLPAPRVQTGYAPGGQVVTQDVALPVILAGLPEYTLLSCRCL
jgi:hypothetical protein